MSLKVKRSKGYNLMGGGALSYNAHLDWVVDEFNLLPNGGRRWHEVPDEGDNQISQGCVIKRMTAFTLAEALITLGIIGVIAALTLPSVITNCKKLVTLNRLKSTYTLLNNTLERAKVDYGTDINQWYIPEGSNKEKSMYFVEHYMLPYLNVVLYCGSSTKKNSCYHLAHYLTSGGTELISPNGEGFGTSFTLNNGTYVYVMVGKGNGFEAEGTNRVLVTFDIDGIGRGYNRFGYDIFMVELGGNEGPALKNNANKNKFLPYLYSPARECSYYVGTVPHACSPNAQYAGGSMCFAYIMCNGWKFGDDYPW